MAAIPNITTSQATSPQLTGILTMAPIPGPLSAVNPNGSAATYTPASSVIVGGDTNGSPFSLQLGTANGTVAAGQVVGGGTAPVAGAQPAAPGAPAAPGTPALVANPVANPLATIGAAAPATTGPTIIAAPGEVPTPTATATPSPAAADMAPGGTGAAVAESGFGAAERSKPMKASVDGATFGFPSFKASAKSNKAPAITWGPGWNRVEKDGMYYMQHANGTKAVPAVEYRVNSSPVGKVQTVKVANGWGKKFPDGTVVVFDRTEGPYRLDAKGKKHQLGLGTHTFGGVKTRIFEASVVRTLEPTGTVTVFDSRGNNRAGTNRGTIAAAISGAGAGAEMASAPTKGGGAPTKGGGADVGDLAGNVDKLTSVARGILDQVRGGNLDPAALASLQAQLNALPAGIVQAAAAAGATSPSPVEGSGPATKSTIPGTTTAGGAAPIAGTDANKATKELAAGAAATLATPAPAELVGKQARFGQLPEAIQVAVATAYGSTRGAKALEADALVSFPSATSVAVVGAETLHVSAVKKVFGAGPGEDLALTMRPGRQPGMARAGATGGAAAVMPTVATTAGGKASEAPGIPVTNGGGSAATTGAATGAAGVGGSARTSTRIQLFPAGGEVRDMALGGLDGTYTWATLPAKARDAIMVSIKANPTEPAGAAYAARTGTGWAMQQDAPVVIASGFATFTGGLTLVRRTDISPAAPAAPAAPTPARAPSPPASAGATTHPVGHDATVPPTAGGGGTGAVAPTTRPPVPAAAAADDHPPGTPPHAH